MSNQRAVWELFFKDNASANIAVLTGNADKASRSFGNAQSSLNSLSGSAKSGEEAFSALGNKIAGAVAAYASFEFGKSVVETTAKFQAFDNVINYTSLSAKDAATNHQFLNNIIEKYKLPITETMEGFSQLNGAMLGSKLQGQGARDVFEGVAVASTALHLSAQQSQSVFLALNQMMSKGKVQAQELTLQLGQAMPGALRLAAQAMGMSSSVFMKEMEKGNIASDKFLPAFAKTLMTTFQGAIPNAVQSLQSKMNEMDNAFIKVKITMGEALMPVIIKVLNGFQSMSSTVVEGIKWLKAYTVLVKSAVVFVGLLAAGYVLYTSALKINMWWQAAGIVSMTATIVETEGLSSAMAYLNSVMAANPIGALIIAVSGLITLLYSLKTAHDDALNAFGNNLSIGIGKDQKQEIEYVNKLIGSYKGLGDAKEEVLKKEKARLSGMLSSLNAQADDYQAQLKQQYVLNLLNPKVRQKKLDEIGALLVASRGAALKTQAQLATLSNKDSFSGSKSDLNKMDKLQEGVDSISENGRSVRNVIVNIGHGIENVNIHSATVKEGAAEMKALFEEWFLRAINGGELALGSN